MIGSFVRELILNFHGLGEPHAEVDANEMRYWWRASSFSRLLDQLLEFPTNNDPRIVITFDDGNASDALLALPELSKRGLDAGFFLCAGRVGKKHYLDQAMIKDLLAAGMSIGSHGMEHRDWRTLDSLALDVEIRVARLKLEDLAQRPVTAVAIPFGSYDRRVLQRLKRESWECIYTSDRGIAHSTSQIKPRETLDADMQDGNILGKLLEAPSLRGRIRRLLSRLYKRLR
jgi:peptidoglycan/xylan/chitin deacetylase (PgdA/CDA1 family)